MWKNTLSAKLRLLRFFQLPFPPFSLIFDFLRITFTISILTKVLGGVAEGEHLHIFPTLDSLLSFLAEEGGKSWQISSSAILDNPRLLLSIFLSFPDLKSSRERQETLLKIIYANQKLIEGPSKVFLLLLRELHFLLLLCELHDICPHLHSNHNYKIRRATVRNFLVRKTNTSTSLFFLLFRESSPGK